MAVSHSIDWSKCVYFMYIYAQCLNTSSVCEQQSTANKGSYKCLLLQGVHWDLTGIYIPPVHNHSCLYCKDSPRIGHRIVPHGQHLATLGRKNALLTGRDLQQNQAQGEAVTGLEGERKPKREKQKEKLETMNNKQDIIQTLGSEKRQWHIKRKKWTGHNWNLSSLSL